MQSLFRTSSSDELHLLKYFPAKNQHQNELRAALPVFWLRTSIANYVFLYTKNSKSADYWRLADNSAPSPPSSSAYDFMVNERGIKAGEGNAFVDFDAVESRRPVTESSRSL